MYIHVSLLDEEIMSGNLNFYNSRNINLILWWKVLEIGNLILVKSLNVEIQAKKFALNIPNLNF